jgi:hypothetical protein
MKNNNRANQKMKVEEPKITIPILKNDLEKQEPIKLENNVLLSFKEIKKLNTRSNMKTSWNINYQESDLRRLA